MAPEDRDRTFEKSLARHLRLGASQPDCLDAELLAAYHERLLAPEQMISCKQHIASCARCQEILAQLEATDDLLVETILCLAAICRAAIMLRPIDRFGQEVEARERIAPMQAAGHKV